MQTSLLPAAEKVYTANLATVEEDQRAIGSLPIVSLALLALALVAIGVGSVIMYGRTNRQFNIGLVVAAATVLLVIGWVVVATQLAASEIERSRTEGSERFEQLANARILAQKARTDETLELIARSDITAGEKSFNGHIDELSKLLDAAPAAAKDGVQKWTASHRKQAEAYDGGDYDAAWPKQSAPIRASAAQFAAVESSLRDGIERTRDTTARSGVGCGCMAGMESNRDPRADGRRCVSGRRRVVAATQGVPMRTRVVVALLAVALTVAGCGSSVAPVSVSVSPVEPWPAGASGSHDRAGGGSHDVPAANADCDREASLRPGPLPSPGAMPPGSTMAAIAERGRLIAGVDQNTYLFGFRNPATGQLEGFDIDIAREIARAIFGDPDRIQLRVLNANQRESALQSGEVDVVVRTYSITCARKQARRFLHGVLRSQPKDPHREGFGNRFFRSAFGQTGVRGVGHHLALEAVRAQPAAEGLRCDHLDGLPPDAATGTGRRDQHRRRGAERAGETGPERGRGRGQHRHRALRHRGQQGERPTWFDSSTVSSSRSATTEPGSGSTKPGCKSSDRPQVLRHRATRTDHDAR